MTREFQQMLQLAAMGATGHSIDVDCSDIEWQKVLELAKYQRVDSYIACALKNNRELPWPSEIRDQLIRETRTLMFSNAVNRSAIVKLLEQLDTAGIHAVLLKGYAIADCYTIPESRRSTDADVWVKPEDEKRACKFMEEHGFTVEPRWKNGHHAVCYHPTMGCVELHVILYDEIVEEVWFGKMDGSEFVIEPHLHVESEDGKYYTLGYTDHFIFLALHMIKHFIISGLTAQMMMDVALYFKKHKAEIDVDRFWDTINSLHYDKLLNSILWAMVRYCGFSKDDLPGVCAEAPDQVDVILTDLEVGGWMGCVNKDAREEGWYEYNRQIILKNKSKTQYLLYMIYWKLDMYVKALFPTKEALSVRYPYVRKHPYLVLFAWVHRLFFRGSKAVRKGVLTNYIITDQEKMTTIGRERIEMFRDLKMLVDK